LAQEAWLNLLELGERGRLAIGPQSVRSMQRIRAAAAYTADTVATAIPRRGSHKKLKEEVEEEVEGGRGRRSRLT